MAETQHVTVARTYLARLMPGESVQVGFQQILNTHRIERGMVISGIGSLVSAQFLGVQPGAKRPFGPKAMTHMAAQGPFEILTLEGNVFPSDQGRIVHLHVTLGTSDGHVIGGHLVDGEVYTTVELLIAALGRCRISKAEDPVAGGIQLHFVPSAGQARPRSGRRRTGVQPER